MPTYEIQNAHGEPVFVVPSLTDKCHLDMNTERHVYTPGTNAVTVYGDLSRSNTGSVVIGTTVVPDLVAPDPVPSHQHVRNGITYTIRHGAALLPDKSWIKHP